MNHRINSLRSGLVPGLFIACAALAVFINPAATGTPGATTITPSQATVSKVIELSTRLRVQTGDQVGIGGFIITGTTPKNVIVRALGPTLVRSGIADVLADPTLELHGPSGFATISNDNWRDTQQTEILDTGVAPTENVEAAIVATLNPGAYTAIVRGNNAASGVALVEIYDLNPDADSKLANLSTRAFVSTGENIVIAGILVSNNSTSDRVTVRGIGPSLSSMGVPNALANPTLELRNNNGSLIATNNDWQDNAVQSQAINAAGLAPTNALESAVMATLPPGLYTALLFGLNDGTGNGAVEVYDLGP